jgi:DMSO reductase anchor subunit
MDKMLWFGWFFKGSMDVSMFDRLMFVVDLLLFVLVVFCIAWAIHFLTKIWQFLRSWTMPMLVMAVLLNGCAAKRSFVTIIDGQRITISRVDSRHVWVCVGDIASGHATYGVMP